MLSLFEKTGDIHQEVFAAGVNEICGSFEVDDSRAEIKGNARLLSKSGMDVALVSHNAEAIHRRPVNIRRDPGNHFFLVMQEDGVTQMCQAETDAELHSGDMYLVDATLPSTFHCKKDVSHQVSVHLPRDDSIARFGRRIRGGMKIDRTDPLAQAMRAILTELLSNDTPRQGHVSEAFLCVLGAYLFNRSLGEVSAPDPDRQIVNRALGVMSQHYADPDFAPVHIANLTGVSLRRLQRAFLTMKNSPRKRLQQVRLDAAKDVMARSSDLKPGQVSMLAFDCGFRDLSTFHRQFKARFGCTPTQWCAQH